MNRWLYDQGVPCSESQVIQDRIEAYGWRSCYGKGLVHYRTHTMDVHYATKRIALPVDLGGCGEERDTEASSSRIGKFDSEEEPLGASLLIMEDERGFYYSPDLENADGSCLGIRCDEHGGNGSDAMPYAGNSEVAESCFARGTGYIDPAWRLVVSRTLVLLQPDWSV